ncbi:endonuclease III domain-containing protein [Neolewinella antarctica]|uniref:Endonuclease-3 n=1 Tax=Neolewinella antarctica TaxID=442734 RepID=A0ABX0X627_9BACT|nr:Fe-S cluster assembly protein HesB [Neolewinella antarctica]NJC24545.1 endonuclease-3 [Neolewinella antarctica]
MRKNVASNIMPKPDTDTDEERRERALVVDEILANHYGAPFIPFSNRGPLTEMVKALLSHRTKNAVTRAGFDNLRTKFPTWQEVIDAPTAAVEAAIRVVTFPEVKAPRIQEALRQVAARNDGELSLDGIHEVSVTDARAWLEEIPGVGAKTSAAVLSFSYLRMKALVVDTHHHRVALRLGVVPPKSSLEKTARLLQSYLPDDWDGQRVYDSHQGYMRHGQRVCSFRAPKCSECVVQRYCAYFATAVESSATKPDEGSTGSSHQ